MNNLMKQAQKMQKQMEEKTKEIETKEWEATAGGGAVTVKVSGKKKLYLLNYQRKLLIQMILRC